MVYKKNLLAMLAVVLVFGMAVVGCNNNSTGGENDGSLDGYWRAGNPNAIRGIIIDDDFFYTDYISSSLYDVTGDILYKAPNFTILTDEGRTIKGTYKLDADTLTINTTDIRYLYLNGWYYKYSGLMQY